MDCCFSVYFCCCCDIKGGKRFSRDIEIIILWGKCRPKRTARKCPGQQRKPASKRGRGPPQALLRRDWRRNSLEQRWRLGWAPGESTFSKDGLIILIQLCICFSSVRSFDCSVCFCCCFFAFIYIYIYIYIYTGGGCVCACFLVCLLLFWLLFFEGWWGGGCCFLFSVFVVLFICSFVLCFLFMCYCFFLFSNQFQNEAQETQREN